MRNERISWQTISEKFAKILDKQGVEFTNDLQDLVNHYFKEIDNWATFEWQLNYLGEQFSKSFEIEKEIMLGILKSLIPDEKPFKEPIWVLTLYKDLGGDEKYYPLMGDWEFAIAGSLEKSVMIEKAKRGNANPLLNLTKERFRVWHSPSIKFSKKHSKLIFDGINEL